jgi:CRISPR/Cas system-associated exonuclease Cas4 (RecB family)
MPGPIKSWSHSRLSEFEKCKRRVFLKNVQKIDEPIRPLLPGKTEHANDRGTRIHDNCERYVRGDEVELCFEAEKHFGMHLAFLRVLYEEGTVSLEGEWGMDRDWCPTDYRTAWFRCKLDAIAFFGKTHAVVIDYKSGKRYGNEIKHGEQMQLYTLSAFLRYPELQEVRTELWYVDLGETAVMTMRRDQGLRFKSNFDRRGHKITDCTDFPPSPNYESCKFCMYGPFPEAGASGHCPDGVHPVYRPIDLSQLRKKVPA